MSMKSIAQFEVVPESAKVPMAIHITRQVLLDAVRASGIDIPEDAQVTFRVPGGGDYSNCDVDLDEDHQKVTIRYYSPLSEVSTIIKASKG